MFQYLMIFLQRTFVSLDFIFKEGKTTKITGPWLEAIRNTNSEIQNLFFDIDQYKNYSLQEFIDAICV